MWKRISATALLLCAFALEGAAFAAPERVVALEGSLAQIWTLAGGTLAGVTLDAPERAIDVGEARTVGSVKSPSLEKILSLEPDLVLLCADIAAQASLKERFDALDIRCRAERVDSFEDYLSTLRAYCDMTGRDDLYQLHGARVEQRVLALLTSVPEGSRPRVLLLRAYSTGVKVKGRDNLAGDMLSRMGCVNIAQSDGAVLEDLSLEAVVREDPDFIFISVMGDEEAARAYLQKNLFEHPAWRALTAVAQARCVFLPKALFHYKPNHRWDESYAFLREVLYGKG